MEPSQENTGAPVATPTVATTPAEVTPAVPFYKKNKQLVIAIAVALILVLGAGYYYLMPTLGASTVAVVNGMKISQKEFDESVQLIEQAATAQGMDLTDEATKAEIKKQALDVLVNNALLLTAAKEAGITVTDDEIQVKYDELVTQLGGADTLAERMAEVGLTEEKLRSNIRERMIADAYIESVTDVEALTVTDAEVDDFLKGIQTQGGELPPLEEIRPQIEAQILSQKQQTLVTDLIQKLKDEGEIEVKI